MKIKLNVQSTLTMIMKSHADLILLSKLTFTQIKAVNIVWQYNNKVKHTCPNWSKLWFGELVPH